MLLRILKWVWQFPQNIIGFCMSRNPRVVSYCFEKEIVPVYFTENVFGCGVCLGDYIILDYYRYCGRIECVDAKKHEYGHHIQSLIFGPLYLIIIGIPSVLINVWDRLFHKNWLSGKRVEWYYKQFPEVWADKLGGVKRKWN